MSSIRPCPLPPDALLAGYAAGGAYADCYTAEVARPVPHGSFIEAFYRGGLMRLERRLIGLVLSRPSTDAQVRELAAGQTREFSAWRVEHRTPNQLLMRDVGGRTRSWLMTVPEGANGTRLYFGSAVVPSVDRATGKSRMGFGFHALLGFHKLYSRLLLGAALARLENA